MNSRRMNRLEELGRVDAEKAYTKKGKRNLGAEKSRIVSELKSGGRVKDKKYKPTTYDKIVDGMGKDYDDNLNKEMLKEKRNREKVNKRDGSIETAEYDIDHHKMESNAANKTLKKYGISRGDFKGGGRALKPVPAGKKGLSKLPTKVRNKMGFMKKGGRVGLKSGGLAKRGRGCEIR